MKQTVIILSVFAIICVILGGVLWYETPSAAKLGSPISREYGTATSTTAQGSAPSITFTGASGRTIYISDIAASVVCSGEVTVSNGSTVIWQQQVNSSSSYTQSFVQPLQGSAGNNVTVSVTGSSTVNASGYYIP